VIQHIFAVGGTFNENGGKPSGYFRQLEFIQREIGQ
jgi:hypothetical protein